MDVLQEVRHKYVVDVSPERERKLVEDMINGGLERLDPHSQYINPHDYKQFDKQSEGKFGGVGIQVGFDRQNRGQLTVISPMVGHAGLRGRRPGRRHDPQDRRQVDRQHAHERGRRYDPGRTGQRRSS